MNFGGVLSGNDGSVEAVCGTGIVVLILYEDSLADHDRILNRSSPAHSNDFEGLTMNRKILSIFRAMLPLAFAFLLAGCGDIRKAAKQGDLNAVKRYLARGVNVNQRSGDGETALHWACREGHAEVVRYLLAQGADPREKGTGCGTPLQWAVSAGQMETATILLEHGADVNQPGTDECRALHVAVQNRNTAMVKFLLTRGADPNAKAAYDRTPLSFAEGPAQSKEIADLLRQHGAKAD